MLSYHLNSLKFFVSDRQELHIIIIIIIVINYYYYYYCCLDKINLNKNCYVSSSKLDTLSQLDFTESLLVL